MSYRRAARSGFTLVELLVVIAIIGILVAIILPAVNSAKKSGQEKDCLNNMVNVALALQLHHNSHSHFPPGVPNCSSSTSGRFVSGELSAAPCQGPNALGAILPYIEENRRKEALDQCLTVSANANRQCVTNVGDSVPGVFVCASARSIDDADYYTEGSSPPLAKGNIALCFGSDQMINSNIQFNGVFDVRTVGRQQFSSASAVTQGKWKYGSDRGVRLEDMKRDGATKTLMVSEVLGRRSIEDGRGAWYWTGMGGSYFTAKLPPNHRPSSSSANAEKDNITACDTAINTDDPESCVKASADAATWAAARSGHSGGVNVVSANKNGHFINDNIDIIVWQALATRNGPSTEPVDAEF